MFFPCSAADLAAILYTSCILVGIFINSSVPIFFELFIETVYPVPEGITCGVVTFLQNLFTGLLLFFLSFYCSGEWAEASGLYWFSKLPRKTCLWVVLNKRFYTVSIYCFVTSMFNTRGFRTHLTLCRNSSNCFLAKHIMDFLQLHSRNLFTPVITDS